MGTQLDIQLKRLTVWFKREFLEWGDETHKWRWRALTIWIVVFSGLVFWALHTERQNVAQNKQNIADIKESRRFAVRRQCENQNERHDATVTKLDQNIAALPEPQKTQARKSEAFTLSLLDALVPVQDCDKVVEFLTRKR